MKIAERLKPLVEDGLVHLVRCGETIRWARVQKKQVIDDAREQELAAGEIE